MFLLSKDKLRFLFVVFIITIVVFNVNVSFSPDFDVYYANWNNLESIDYSEFLWSLLHLLSKKILFGKNYKLFLFCISFIIIYYKLTYLKDLVNSNLILIFYSSSFLILHESIQIRLSFGLLFVLKSIKMSKENNGLKSWWFLFLASLVHLSLIFFVIVKLIGILAKNKIIFLFTIAGLFIFFRVVSSQDNIILLIDHFSQIGEEWSLKLSKYLYDILELASVKPLPLQIYYVGITYLFYLFLNFKKKLDTLNELILISFFHFLIFELELVFVLAFDFVIALAFAFLYRA